MADINIERKKPSLWPWILALLLIALLIWAAIEFLGEEEPQGQDPPAAESVGVTEEETTATPQAPEPAEMDLPAEVAAYTDGPCTRPMDASQQQEMGMQHQFTTNCLEQLSSALTALTERNQATGPEASQGLDTLRQRIQALQQSDPQANSHAGTTREAFVSTADLLTVLHQTQHAGQGDLEQQIEEVRQAARSVQENQLMLDQKQAVHDFFREAGEVVRRLAEARNSA